MSHMWRQKALEIARVEKRKPVRASKGDPLDGPEIREYLGSVGASPGKNYCVAFVYWCYREAALRLGCPNVLPKTASGSLFKSWSHDSWLLGKGEPLEAGDIYIRADFSHTGIIDSGKSGRGETYTVEGNTWRVKYDWGVHGRRRDLSNAYIIRPTW